MEMEVGETIESKKMPIGERDAPRCLTCRSKKVKCDEGVPFCGRCVRLNLICHQPPSRIVKGAQNANLTSIRSLAARPQENICLMSPRSVSLSEPGESTRGETQPNTRPYTASFGGEDEITTEGAYVPRSPSSNAVLDVEERLECSVSQSPVAHALNMIQSNPGIGAGAAWYLPFPQESSMPFHTNLEFNNPWSFSIPTKSPPKDIVPSSRIVLDRNEQQALAHFRTTFSLSQTTRDPERSTPALLLRHALESSEMLLHFILAISLHGLSPSSEQFSKMRVQAHKHYELGTQELMISLQNASYADEISTLGSLYCIYIYMLGQKIFSVAKLDRLSLTTAEYIETHKLDLSYLGPGENLECAHDQSQQSFKSRLILWLLKLDAHCSFLGCTPFLVEHFKAKPTSFTCIQAQSRLALQLNWGRSYPISQSIRDIESCLPVDMMAEMLLILGSINSFQPRIHCQQSVASIDELISELNVLEVKYSTVFYYASSDMTLQPAMKLNCANSAVMFYGLKIHLFQHKLAASGGAETLSTLQALSRLLFYARYVCPSGCQQPVYEFQWSLFVAAIETDDMIHQEWLQERITNKRFRMALQQISRFKSSGNNRLALSILRQVLHGD